MLLLSALLSTPALAATPEALLQADADALVEDASISDAELAALSDHDNWRVRQRAQLALGLRNNAPLFEEALQQAPIRTRAGFEKFARGAIAEPGAMPAVLERIQSDEDTAIRAALAEVVAKNHADGWSDALLDMIASHPDASVRAGLLYGLRTADADIAETGLRAALSDASAQVRSEAVRIVGWRKDGKQLGSEVLSALSDSDAQVRAAAARTSGWLELSDARRDLRRLTSDADSKVRFEALNALIRIAPSDAAELAPGLLDDADPAVVRVAKRASKL